MKNLNPIVIATIQLLLSLALFTVIFYLMGVFVAQDWNPARWLLFSTIVGRVLFLIIVIPALLKASIDFLSE